MRIRARNMRYCLSPAPAFLPGESCRASETDIHEEEGPRRRGRVSGSGGREPGTGWRQTREFDAPTPILCIIIDDWLKMTLLIS